MKSNRNEKERVDTKIQETRNKEQQNNKRNHKRKLKVEK